MKTNKKLTYLQFRHLRVVKRGEFLSANGLPPTVRPNDGDTLRVQDAEGREVSWFWGKNRVWRETTAEEIRERRGYV